jgi:predicted  nucleic acid-binding Zn-ribbon protein
MHTWEHVLSILLVLIAGAFASIGADDQNGVVRRSSFRYSLGDESGVAEPVHCVVWGEKELKGIKFYSKAEAESTFNALKRTEAIAAYYKKMVEVHRHVTPHVSSPSWRKMREWCHGDHPNADQPNLLEEDMVREAPPPAAKAPRDEQSSDGDGDGFHSLLDISPSKREHAPKRRGSGRFLMDDSDNDATDSDVNDRRDEEFPRERRPPKRRRASSIDDDDEMARERRPPKRSRASSIDDDDEVARPRSRRPARQQRQKKGRSMRSEESSVREESSFLGNGKGLGSRIAAMDNELQKIASDAADLARQVGTQQQAHHSSSVFGVDAQGGLLKDRIARVEDSFSGVDKSVSSIERELMGRPSSSSSSSKGSPSRGGVKKRADALEANVKNLRSRLGSLQHEIARVTEQLDKVDGRMEWLVSKASSLLQNIGEAAPELPQTPYQDASLLDRFNGIADFADRLQRSVNSLEAELAGGTRSRGSDPRKLHHSGSFDDNLKALQDLMNNMKARLATLEKEV